ncbi:hypothetical protein ACVSQB_01990 [Bradyrhizobium elkanii]
MSATPPSAELARIAEAIEAGDLTAEQRRKFAQALRELRLAPARFTERDELILAARRTFFSKLSARQAATEIATGLARYAATAWLRDRTAEVCPDRIAGHVNGAYWRILKSVPRPVCREKIRKIVGI